jgi:hypothetical protein
MEERVKINTAPTPFIVVFLLLILADAPFSNGAAAI